MKLKYLPAQRRVRVEFSKADCMQSQLPPKSIYERAKQKLEDERQLGHVAYYYLDFPRLVKIWRRMALSWEEPTTTVAVTLGAGAPPMAGVHVTKAEDPAMLAEISFTAAVAEMRQWRLHFLNITIAHHIKELGLSEKANPAEIHSLWLRALAGEKISGAPLHAVPKFLKLDERRHRPYEVVTDPVHRHLAVIVYDLVSLIDVDLWERLKRDLKEKVQALSEANRCTYHVLSEELLLRLRSALRGPERYGLDLPFVQLVATPLPNVSCESNEVEEPLENVSAAPPQPTKPAARPKERAPANADKILFKLTEDKSEASIATVPPALKRNPNSITADLIKAHAHHQGITHGFLPNLEQIAQAPDKLQGAVIAHATPGEPGAKPTLQSIMGQVRGTADDVRNRGPRKYVQAGEVIAVVKYETAPRPGMNVLGEATPPPQPSDRLAVQLGDGVACEDGETYIATKDGTPVVGANDIRLVDGYLHEGNVNHTTGDVVIAGNVEIHGSLEYGAIVKVKGNLTIDGDVNGGYIYCTGNVTVKGGIRSGDTGKVTVLGSLNASFIENARVFCNGDIIIEKSILASTVYSSGELTVTSSDGLLAGGDVRTGGSVTSQNIGQDKGSVTRIKTSVDWRKAERAETLRSRLNKVQSAYERYRGEVSEIQRKRPEQRSKKMSERLERGRLRARKAKSLAEAISEKFKVIDGSANLSNETTISVPGQLSSNVDIMIGQQLVKVSDTCQNVSISGMRRAGSYIHKLSKDNKSNKDKDAA